MASDKDEILRLRDENARLFGAYEAAERHAKENEALTAEVGRLREALSQRPAGPPPKERLALKPGNVWAYVVHRYVLEEGGKARVVPPGDLVQVAEKEFHRDQQHRYPHLEGEATHDRREADLRKKHTEAVDGELQQIEAGHQLAAQMAEVRRQQQQVTAAMLVDAGRLAAQMPPGPVKE